MTRRTLNHLSVIIPVAAGDRSWIGLIPDLMKLPQGAEILFSSPDVPGDAGIRMAALLVGRSVHWIQAPPGRARQLNAAARRSTRPVLWFLHADSRFTSTTLSTLEQALALRPEGFHYFDLEFLDDGPGLMRINQAGVWFRSHAMGIPFGDQAFCLPRPLFDRLGGYREDAPYGEDHLLVWAAHHAGTPPVFTGGSIRTSARKYREQGWARTTLRHGVLTFRQAFPEWLTRLRLAGRYSRKRK